MLSRLLGAALSLAVSPAAFSAESLTLQQAIRMAVDRNRTVRNSLLDVAKADDRFAATRTRQFPSVSFFALGSQQLRSIDFTFERGVFGNFPGIGEVPAQNTLVSTPLKPTAFLFGRVAQPLSNLYRIRLNLGLLRIGVRLAQEQTRAQRQDTARSVKRVYYGLQQAEASLQSVRETLKLYQELTGLTARYVEQQVALKGDLLEVEMRQAKVEQTELTIVNQHASGKEQLNQLLGRDVLTDFTVTPVAEIGEVEADLAAARKLALEQRPEIRQARLRQEQAQQDLRAKRAEYIPEVAAEFNSITLLNFGRFLPVQSNSVGLSLTWEPFDFGRKKHEVAEKRHTVEQADNAAADAESLILVDVNDKFRQLQQSRAQLRVARLGQAAALENLRVTKNKYEVQAALLKDVLQGQATLEQANADYQQALVAFWNARADFERATGEDP